MDIKTATALAIFGSILITLVQLLYTINSFINNFSFSVFDIQIPSYIPNVLYLLGCMTMLVFFGALYGKQNRDE